MRKGRREGREKRKKKKEKRKREKKKLLEHHFFGEITFLCPVKKVLSVGGVDIVNVY